MSKERLTLDDFTIDYEKNPHRFSCEQSVDQIHSFLQSFLGTSDNRSVNWECPDKLAHLIFHYHLSCGFLGSDNDQMVPAFKLLTADQVLWFIKTFRDSWHGINPQTKLCLIVHHGIAQDYLNLSNAFLMKEESPDDWFLFLYDFNQSDNEHFKKQFLKSFICRLVRTGVSRGDINAINAVATSLSDSRFMLANDTHWKALSLLVHAFAAYPLTLSKQMTLLPCFQEDIDSFFNALLNLEEATVDNLKRSFDISDEDNPFLSLLDDMLALELSYFSRYTGNTKINDFCDLFLSIQLASTDVNSFETYRAVLSAFIETHDKTSDISESISAEEESPEPQENIQLTTMSYGNFLFFWRRLSDEIDQLKQKPSKSRTESLLVSTLEKKSNEAISVFEAASQAQASLST